MKTYGLTGGIGMGKSTAAKILAGRGVPIVDKDAIARQVVEPGEPALAEVAEKFGRELIDADGRLDRAALGRRVFADEAARKELEAILHPRIRAIWQAQLASWRNEGRVAGVVVIPLLFETNAASQFDCVVCVACSFASQRRRLIERGLSAEQIDQRVKAQLPIEKKMALSDFVVWTEGSVEVHAEQLGRIIPQGGK